MQANRSSSTWGRRGGGPLTLAGGTAGLGYEEDAL